MQGALMLVFPVVVAALWSVGLDVIRDALLWLICEVTYFFLDFMYDIFEALYELLPDFSVIDPRWFNAPWSVMDTIFPLTEALGFAWLYFTCWAVFSLFRWLVKLAPWVG